MSNISKKTVSLLLVLMTIFGCFSGMIVFAETDGSETESSVLIITVPQTSEASDVPVVLSASEGDTSAGDGAKAVGGTVTSITVDTGNKDKSKVSCLGGSFKVTVKGTGLYNKIAVFDGSVRVGDPVLVGKEGSASTSETISKGKLNLPANNTNVEVSYSILAFPGSMKNEEITAAKGQKFATVKVESRKDAFEITPLKLTYDAKGGTLDISIKTNCSLSATVADSSWISMIQPDGQMKLRVTAKANSGAQRKNTITFSTTGAGGQTAVVEITQSGLDNVYRLRGSNRVATSAAISYYGWSKAETVILASGVNFADALAGAPLSAAADAPILLTMNKKEGAEKAILDEIKRLGAKKVYILGGTSAVNAAIEKDVKNEGCTVTRLYGKSRYGTAVAIAQELSKVKGGTFSKLYFTNANNYPDALSISSVAAIEGNPILYMPTTGSVESTTKAFVTESKCKTGVVLGGTGAVSAAGYDSLAGMGLGMSRISGKDRYKTSVAINEKYASLFSGEEIALATGINFPDALAGSALCARMKMPVVLASDKSYSDARTYIRSDANKNVKTFIVFGGTGAMSDKLVVDLVYDVNAN